MRMLIILSAGHELSDNPPIIKAKSDYAPSAPLGRTHTTLVGEVKGDPAPHPNRESAPQLISKQDSQLKPINVDSGLESTPSSPSLPMNSSSTSNTQRTYSTSSTGSSAYVKNPKRRPKSQHIIATAATANLPPKAPSKKNRHSYHQQQNGLKPVNQDQYSNYDPQQTQQLFGSNHNLASAHQGLGSQHNLAGQQPRSNLSTAQYFGSMHDLPDRQVVHNDESYADQVKYADLDQKAFMIPKNQVLPKMDRLEYAELQVSRSKIV